MKKTDQIINSFASKDFEAAKLLLREVLHEKRDAMLSTIKKNIIKNLGKK